MHRAEVEAVGLAAEGSGELGEDVDAGGDERFRNSLSDVLGVGHERQPVWERAAQPPATSAKTRKARAPTTDPHIMTVTHRPIVVCMVGRSAGVSVPRESGVCCGDAFDLIGKLPESSVDV